MRSYSTRGVPGATGTHAVPLAFSLEVNDGNRDENER
jgi:hypothetical protein